MPKQEVVKGHGEEMKIHKLDVEKEMNVEKFRVAIFGSARVKEGDKVYQEVYELAKAMGERKFDVVTGGGPGLMEAANRGHHDGDVNQESESIGLNIKLPFEQHPNQFVEFVKDFEKFSNRLETFMKLSNVFIITPGGVGTMLEFFYTWQILQVKKMEYKPIILVGEMWRRLIYWVIDYALKDNLLSANDFEYIYIVKNNEEAIKLIEQFHKQVESKGKCWHIKMDTE